MFAVIKTGGKQYRVAAADLLAVATLPGEPGHALALDQVLTVTGEGVAQVGGPTVAGVTVAATVVEHTRGRKVIAFKKRRRKNSRRKRGHRQDLTVVRIAGINADGSARAKAASEPAAPASA